MILMLRFHLEQLRGLRIVCGLLETMVPLRRSVLGRSNVVPSGRIRVLVAALTLLTSLWHLLAVTHLVFTLCLQS